MASGKIISAPASTQAMARSMAACSPSTARASVRAMMTNESSTRASTAILMRSTISACETISFARPMTATLGRDLILDMDTSGSGLGQRANRPGQYLKAPPNPVSPSTSKGRSQASVMRRTSIKHILQPADPQIRHAQRIGRQDHRRKDKSPCGQDLRPCVPSGH